MKIRMTETVQGSLDGKVVIKLEAGNEYETEDSPRGERLARYHLRKGVAVSVEAVAVPAKPVRKRRKK